MELFEAIARRHSYRGPFVARPLPRADLVRMVEAAMHAPSGYNAQTTPRARRCARRRRSSSA
jgi:nitroreductase